MVAFVAFFLSSILGQSNNDHSHDLLFYTKQVTTRETGFLLRCVVVMQRPTQGGARTPIGDVTTTMLWINGQIIHCFCHA